MKNYDRYQKYTEKKYSKKYFSHFIMKGQADKLLLPYIQKIKKKKVLEVGPGYGYYTKYLLQNHNIVEGYDINPDLGKNIGINIIRGHANHLAENVTEKYDYVMSFFMTEYLNSTEMARFMSQGIKLLRPNGKFVTTVILNRGLGWLYITLARMKRVQKYNYSEMQIREMIGDENKITTIPLDTIWGIPFAILVEVDTNKV